MTPQIYRRPLFFQGFAALLLTFSAFPAVEFACAQPPTPAAKVRRYADRLWRQYDRDGDSFVSADEWKAMRGDPARIDSDGDQRISADEMVQHIVRYAAGRRLAPPPDPAATSQRFSPLRPPGGSVPSRTPGNQTQPTGPAQRKPYYVPRDVLPQNLPDWFLAEDLSGDGQLSLAEYAPTAEAQRVREFEQLDANGDGLVTPQEVLQQK